MQDSCTKLYSISRDNKTISRDLELSNGSTSPKGIFSDAVEPLQQSADDVSLHSFVSGIDQVSLITDPIVPNVCGAYENSVDERSPPRLSYAFHDQFEYKETILEKLSKYQSSKDQKADISKKNAPSPKKVSSPKCPNETMEDFVRSIKTNATQWKKEDGKEVEKPKRFRRKITEGSYPNQSVDEKNLPKLLRFVWKGKLNKLKKYLADETKHSKINRQDECGR